MRPAMHPERKAPGQSKPAAQNLLLPEASPWRPAADRGRRRWSLIIGRILLQRLAL